MNVVTLVGNLTRDVDLKYTQSGTAVASGGMAINEKYKNSSGDWVESPVFVDLTFWGRTAEVASEYTQKGSKIGVVGKLKYDTWETQEGVKRSKLTVTVERFEFLGAKQADGASTGGNGNGKPAASQRTTAAADEYAEEEVPF